MEIFWKKKKYITIIEIKRHYIFQKNKISRIFFFITLRTILISTNKNLLKLNYFKILEIFIRLFSVANSLIVFISTNKIPAKWVPKSLKSLFSVLYYRFSNNCLFLRRHFSFLNVIVTYTWAGCRWNACALAMVPCPFFPVLFLKAISDRLTTPAGVLVIHKCFNGD